MPLVLSDGEAVDVSAARLSEAAIEAAALREAGRIPDVLLIKNEVGVSYRGAVLPALQAALAPFGPAVVAAAISTLKRHYIRHGLGVGSSDLVGAVAGRAFTQEMKTAVGVVSAEQEQWMRAVRKRGVHAGVSRSAGDLLAAIERARRGEVE